MAGDRRARLKATRDALPLAVDAGSLCSVGRRKFLKPIYTELMKTQDGASRARAIYEKARPGYHPIAQATIDTLVQPVQSETA